MARMITFTVSYLLHSKLHVYQATTNVIGQNIIDVNGNPFDQQNIFFASWTHAESMNCYFWNLMKPTNSQVKRGVDYRSIAD